MIHKSISGHLTTKPPVRLVNLSLLCVMSASLLAGCSDSGQNGLSSDLPPSNAQAGSVDQVTAPNQLTTLQSDPLLLNDVPSVSATVTLADSGLQVAFTNVAQSELIDPLYIERQWQFMQTCLNSVATAPLVIVTEGTVRPLTSEDDVLRHIDGSVLASASQGDAGASLQISAADFDGSLGNIGFNLRSIMGRYLWLASGLEERDYPFSCAREMPL